MRIPLIVCLLLSAPVFADPAESLLFAVSHEGSECTLDPVGYVRNGKLVEAVNGAEPVAMGKRALAFIDRYYPPSQAYQVLGGGRISVQSSEAVRRLAKETARGEGGAWSMAVPATPAPKGRSFGLAVNFPVAHPQQPTPASGSKDRKRFSTLAVKQWGKATRVVDVLRHDFDHDGKAEWLGVVDFATGPTRQSALMLLDDSGKVVLQRTNAGDFAVMGAVDVDQDGVDEIVVRRQAEGGWGYVVYSRRKGQWRSIYSGGGGGC